MINSTETDQDGQANTIAVVVPNYNHGHFLSESLGSIANQTHAPDEVLVIDDGSHDNSVEIINGFLKNRPNWRMIAHKENCGVVRRLNEGIAAVKSKWITMFGADDVLDPEYVGRIKQMTAQYSSAGLACACVAIFGDAMRPRLRPPILPSLQPGYVTPEQFRKLLRVGDNYFVGTTTTYQRQAILEVGGLNEQLGSMCDGYLARQVAARHGFAFIPRILGYWRIHGQNYSVATAKDPRAYETGIQTLRRALEHEPTGIFPEAYADILERRLRFSAARLVVLDRNIPPRQRAAAVTGLLHLGRWERFIIRLLGTLGTVGSVLTLGWLTARLRPLSLYALIRNVRPRRAILKQGRIASLRPPGKSR